MTIKQQGGIFGRNPTFNDVTVDGTLTTSGTVNVSGDAAFNTDTLYVDTANDRVGVRTATPDASFEVVGEAIVGSGTYGVKLTYSGGNQSGIIDTADSANNLEFRVQNSKKLVINSSGNLVVNSGSGIDFSATSGTGTSELFDDYEEGAFTSSMTCGTSGTIPGTVNGTYVKVGQMVTCTGEGYVPTAPSSPTGNVQIALPFTSGTTGSGSGKRSAGSIIMHSVASANIADFHILTTENSATAYIQLGDATTRQDDSAQQFQQYTDFRFCITYFTA